MSHVNAGHYIQIFPPPYHMIELKLLILVNDKTFCFTAATKK